nr:immunoglobulin light chain junction region [Macaca mulatta]MOW00775.1 immunoglobulin light chain junction region [Macaca mulatta]
DYYCYSGDDKSGSF